MMDGSIIPDKVRIYSLSTCAHCAALKKMLQQHGIAYEFIDIDLMTREERQQFLQEISPYNPQKIFPIIIVNNKAIVGFRRELIERELGIK